MQRTSAPKTEKFIYKDNTGQIWGLLPQRVAICLMCSINAISTRCIHSAPWFGCVVIFFSGDVSKFWCVHGLNLQCVWFFSGNTSIIWERNLWICVHCEKSTYFWCTYTTGSDEIWLKLKSWLGHFSVGVGKLLQLMWILSSCENLEKRFVMTFSGAEATLSLIEDIWLDQVIENVCFLACLDPVDKWLHWWPHS